MRKVYVLIMPYQFKCKFCQLEFKHKNKHAKYCSQKCTKEDSKKGTTGICSNCQGEFYVVAYKINTRKAKKLFCCWDCHMEHQRNRRPIRVCVHCQKEFKKRCRKDAKFCSSKCRLESDYNIYQLAAMRKKQAQKNINKLERCGYELLTQLGIRFEPQFVFCRRYVADAYLPDYNIIVQFDGDYWHGNIKRFPSLSDFQKKVQANDAKSDELARAEGLKVLRIWESEIRSEVTKERILSFIEESNHVSQKNRRGSQRLP